MLFKLQRKSLEEVNKLKERIRNLSDRLGQRYSRFRSQSSRFESTGSSAPNFLTERDHPWNLDKLKKNSYDAVITGIEILKLDGVLLTRPLLGVNPYSPIMAMNGFTWSTIILRLKVMGPN